MLTITLTRDDITPDLRRILKSITPGGALGKVLGRATANALRSHFRSLNASRPNKIGGKRTNFWSRVAESVQNPQTQAGGITVAISHPHIAQRLFGGTISPRKKKSLAIPTSPKSYGTYARIYPGKLAFIPGTGGTTRGYLVEGQEQTITRGKRKGGKRTIPKPGGALLYVLKSSVTQRPDPSVLPKSATISAALTRAASLVKV